VLANDGGCSDIFGAVGTLPDLLLIWTMLFHQLFSPVSGGLRASMGLTAQVIG
jgi:hypothetical protein